LDVKAQIPIGTGVINGTVRTLWLLIFLNEIFINVSAGGSSNLPCDDTFHGATAFSEVEVKAMADFFDTIADRAVFFLSVHSYSQYILLPYGFSNERYPDYDEYVKSQLASFILLS
jgi:hypothetical protein